MFGNCRPSGSGRGLLCAAGQAVVCQAVQTSKLQAMLITHLALLPGQKPSKALIILEKQYMLDDSL